MRTTSMVGIFQDLSANRKEARAAQMQYVVMSVSKNGMPRKVTASDLQYNATRTPEEATIRKVQLEALNPGKSFTIVPL